MAANVQAETPSSEAAGRSDGVSRPVRCRSGDLGRGFQASAGLSRMAAVRRPCGSAAAAGSRVDSFLSWGQLRVPREPDDFGQL